MPVSEFVQSYLDAENERLKLKQMQDYANDPNSMANQQWLRKQKDDESKSANEEYWRRVKAMYEAGVGPDSADSQPIPPPNSSPSGDWSFMDRQPQTQPDYGTGLNGLARKLLNRPRSTEQSPQADSPVSLQDMQSMQGISGQQPYSSPAPGSPGVPQVGPLGRTQPEPPLQAPPTTGFGGSDNTGGPPVQADSNSAMAAYFKNFMGSQNPQGPPGGADTLGQPTPGNRMAPTQAGAANEMVGQGAGQGAGGGVIAPMAPFLPQPQGMALMRAPDGTVMRVPKPATPTDLHIKGTKYLEKLGFGKEGSDITIPSKDVPNVLPTIFGGQNQQIAAEVKGDKPAKAPVINQQIMDSVVAMAAADPSNQKAFNDAGVNPKEVSDLSDLPLSLQEGAIQKYGRLQPNADVANTMKLAIAALDGGRNRELNDKQVLAGQKAQLVIDHPEAYFHIKDPEEQRIVEKAILNKNGKIPINEPTGQDKIALGQANRVFDALANIRRLSKQLGPQATGAVAGRFSEAEGRWGDPIFEKDPQKASTEAQLRSEMTYLMGSELKTIFTGRPAVQMLNMMKNVSPSVKQYYGMLDGSMNGMEEMAASAVHSSRDRMFDEHTKLRHRTSNQPDPQTGLPKHQYSWDDGKTWLPLQQ